MVNFFKLNYLNALYTNCINVNIVNNFQKKYIACEMQIYHPRVGLKISKTCKVKHLLSLVYKTFIDVTPYVILKPLLRISICFLIKRKFLL